MAKLHRWPKAAVPLLAVCLLAADAGSATGGPGYLPAIGPVPVRFGEPSQVVPVVLWPPLLQPEQQTLKGEPQMTNAPAAQAPRMESLTNAIPLSMTTASPPAAPPPSDAAPPSDAPPPPNIVNPFPIFAPSQPDQAADVMVDPKSLLDYLLSVSTNESGVKVLMPVFVPPVPPLPYPSSHASYESR
jgi:hypothetical protein